MGLTAHRLFSKAMAQLHDMVRRDSSNISEKKYLTSWPISGNNVKLHVFYSSKNACELSLSSLVWDQRENNHCDIYSMTRKKLQKSSTKTFSYKFPNSFAQPRRSCGMGELSGASAKLSQLSHPQQRCIILISQRGL